MSINQKHVTELIVKLLKGELVDEQEKQALEAWLSADSRNQHFVDELKSYANVEGDINLLSTFDEKEAWRKIRDLRRKRTTQGIRYYLSRIAVVLVVLCTVGALTYQLLGREDIQKGDKKIVKHETGKYKNDVLPADNIAKLILADGSTVSVEQNNVVVKDGVIHLLGSDDLIYQEDSEAEPTYHTLVVPRASFFHVVLADGTKVWLNAMSQLHFPSTFVGNERRVILEGEGYFEVASNPERPFYVEAGGTAVKVLGTHFNVDSYRRKVKTTLVEGQVEVHSGNDRQLLISGEESESDYQQIKVRKADIAKAVAWKNGEFHFKGDNIAQIANQLGLWYDLDIRFRGQLVLDRRYTGRISRDSKLTEVLEMLEHVSNLAFEVKGKELIIRETQKNNKLFN